MVRLALEQAIAAGHEQVVVGRTEHATGIEALSDLEALGRGQRHHALGQLRLQLVEARLAEANRHTCDHASADTARAVLLPPQLVDAGRHLGRRRGVGAPGVDQLAIRKLQVTLTCGSEGRAVGPAVLLAVPVDEVIALVVLGQCPLVVDEVPVGRIVFQLHLHVPRNVNVHHRVHPANNLAIELLLQPLLCDRAGRDTADGLACGGAAAAAGGASAILHLVSVVRMAWPRRLDSVGIVELFLVLVVHHHGDRRPQRLPVLRAGEDGDDVALVPRGDDGALAGAPPGELRLHIRLRQVKVGGDAVNYAAHTNTMRLTEGGYAEQHAIGAHPVSKSVASRLVNSLGWTLA
mmetsp:Transcript_59902/g.154764  ORF Transcript_59902/g.154764 Transcript_59902/m.154764 type:complete len:349 (+) Transcript_59902:583-1629(+)